MNESINKQVFYLNICSKICVIYESRSLYDSAVCYNCTVIGDQNIIKYNKFVQIYNIVSTTS